MRETAESTLDIYREFISENGFLEFTSIDMEWGNTKKIFMSVEDFDEAVSRG